MKLSLDFTGNKGFRLIYLYERLNRGESIKKSELAQEMSVSEKSIQRDIEDLRAYLIQTHFYEEEMTIRYEKSSNSYLLVRLNREWFNNEEVLAMCKILLESRAFNKREISGLLEKLLAQVTPKDRQLVNEIILYEKNNYVPLKHGKDLLTLLWQITQAIYNHEIIEFRYQRQDGMRKNYRVIPLSILFSEFYFYLNGYVESDQQREFRTFRIDRMKEFTLVGEKFSMPYHEKFNDGEFRKQVLFMYGGELKKVKFYYFGSSSEVVVDRLPTAKLLESTKERYLFEVEAFSQGLEMWFAMQGEKIKIIE